MSLINVLLSNKQVVLSLVMVGGILIFALALAVGPSIYATGKQIMARRKAKQAAQLARKRKAQAQRKRAALAKAKAQAALAAGMPPLPPGVRAVYSDEAAPLLATVDESVEATDEQPVAAAPVAVTTDAEAADETAADETEETEESTEEEKKPDEFSPETDLQNLLDSVFTNDEQNERYEVLLRDTEVVSAEALLTLARQVAGDLRARNGYRAERQLP